ncbi:50S ribosomal protein L3 [Tremella mesenterica]|uniref:Large ribosomal subunit protein uL3m n=1 Tax=Tremella mesenterica TaxID=5217 RepID=A0A4Q1BUR6_TREME|nr:uncharacterized protein TREMEDRAFT_28317 [Tremella mesenterica DSM 1558]EIW71602.1 hypothetical protein TREMEDRAFT_28317 [Tremella mesenterica DSM 1558]RXK41835.1 50S ribosomal protein L3 [Tremella mesenterica]
MSSFFRKVTLGTRILRRGLATAVTEAQLVASSSLTEAGTSSAPATQAKWTPYTQRTGAIARKRGMMSVWDQDGKRWPVTVLQIDSCQVIRHSPPPANNHLHSLQLGASPRAERTTPKPLLGHFKSAGVPPKYRLQEYQVTSDAVLPVGTELSAGHFVPGQYVDVTGVSIGKGFQGVMKRHGFRGLSASHGVSLKHRSGGSTGQNQDPGRVIPGKKMAGHMGVDKCTVQNLLVHHVDLALNVIYVRGCVPGTDDSFVSVRDAKKKVNWRGQKGLRRGLDEHKWLGEGVTSLPTPAGTKERVEKEGWPVVSDWAGRSVHG